MPADRSLRKTYTNSPFFSLSSITTMDSAAWMQDARQKQEATIQQAKETIACWEEDVTQRKQQIAHNEGMLAMLKEMDGDPESEQKAGLMSEIESSKRLVTSDEREIAKRQRNLANYEKTLVTLNARLLQSEAGITASTESGPSSTPVKVESSTPVKAESPSLPTSDLTVAPTEVAAADTFKVLYYVTYNAQYMPTSAYCNVNAYFSRDERKVVPATLHELALHIRDYHTGETATGCQTVDLGPTFRMGVHAHLTVPENAARLAHIEATNARLALAEAQPTASGNDADLAEAKPNLKRKR
ncbi:hypothetical protein HBI56_225750 [Parastagonospora nodorum]|nr:hypothetical protein HBH56_239370 [Parastagonospora nodorum]KAH3921615.1 hypothetical protein HBH54_236670 [Parastagonospora nodorum]KAH3939783.1 hypothetical protein HBH53_228590 [Parastagonospora nodorum]KAH3994070.1 hypothetical protein HBI10_191880 [Parastagonospora nodorum]KAH4008637.1 hypothetical protein HBI13_234000 [Parastagonospora nodorum]